MPSLSKKTSSLPRSVIRNFRSYAIELKNKNVGNPDFKLYRLSTGQLDFRSSTAAIEASKKAFDEGATEYIDSTGILPLRKEVAELNGVGIENVVFTHGCGFSLFSGYLATLDACDEVLLPDITGSLSKPWTVSQSSILYT